MKIEVTSWKVRIDFSTMTPPEDTFELKLCNDWKKAKPNFQEIADDARKKRAKQHAIDRIAWEAERQQRYQKGGKWK